MRQKAGRGRNTGPPGDVCQTPAGLTEKTKAIHLVTPGTPSEFEAR
jgi:hypothetical protein